MKTQMMSPGYFKTVLSTVLVFGSLNCFSQPAQTESDSIPNQTGMTSLQNVVDGIKAKNEAIKNEKHVNVMVNDVLIVNVRDFAIDPKRIALVEVLVLPKPGSESIKSIIINTRK